MSDERKVQPIDDKNAENDNRSSSETTAGSTATATATALNIASPNIFSLNLDCFEELFALLPIRDLNVLSQTCTKMQLIVGYYMRENLSAFELFGRHDGFYLPFCCPKGCKALGFEEIIQNLTINCDGLHDFENAAKRFHYVGTNCNKNLKKIQFNYLQLTGREIQSIKDILINIETVVIYECRMNRTFYERFPAICGNLKYLHIEPFISNRNVVKRSGNQWLLRNWPKLEHMGWIQNEKAYKIDEIGTFFKLNPNIRSFSTKLNCLWASQQSIIESNVKLDELTVIVDHWQLADANFLNELYVRGFYKRLRLFAKFKSEHLNQVVSIKGFEALRHPCVDDGTHLSNLTMLKELRMGYSPPLPNWNILPECLEHLERIHLRVTDFNVFLPFIYRSRNLKEAKFDIILNDDHSGFVRDLPRINNERKKIQGARKVTIYIDQMVYLATKWKYGNTDFGSIEIKHAHGHEWAGHVQYY